MASILGLAGVANQANSANQAQAIANANNIAIYKDSKKYNTAEAEKARAFSSAEAQKARDWQSDAFNATQTYNAAEAEKARAYGYDVQGISQKFNQSEAEKNRLFQANEVQKARDWENMMSSTAWQRGMADMKKAGMNPMLAFMQGGASTPNVRSAQGSLASSGTPSGGQASVQSKTSGAAQGHKATANQGRVEAANVGYKIMADKIMRTVSNSLEARRLRKDLGIADKQKALLEDQASKTRADEQLSKASAARQRQEEINVALRNREDATTQTARIHAKNARERMRRARDEMNRKTMWFDKISGYASGAVGVLRGTPVIPHQGYYNSTIRR